MLGNAPTVLFKRIFSQEKMLGVDPELLYFCSECASCLASIFVVKVEGPLNFSLGGKLFLMCTSHVVQRSIQTPWEFFGRALKRGVDKAFKKKFPMM